MPVGSPAISFILYLPAPSILFSLGATFAQIVFGIVADSGGRTLGAGGIHVIPPVNPGDPEWWTNLPLADQGVLLGLAFKSMAEVIPDIGAQQEIEQAAINLVQNSSANLTASSASGKAKK